MFLGPDDMMFPGPGVLESPGKNPSEEMPETTFEVGDRVRVRSSYVSRLPVNQSGVNVLYGRCGTVVQVDANRIDVVLDKTHPRATPYVFTFVTSAALQLESDDIDDMDVLDDDE